MYISTIKKAVIIGLIGLIFVPSVTFAAWYKPWTWFKTEKKETIIPSIQAPVPTIEQVQATTTATTTPSVKKATSTPAVKKVKPTEKATSTKEKEEKDWIYSKEEVVAEMSPQVVNVKCVKNDEFGRMARVRDGSGIFISSADGYGVMMSRHGMYVSMGEKTPLTDYCDVVFPYTNETYRVPKNMMRTSKEYDRGFLIIDKPSNNIISLYKKTLTVLYCNNLPNDAEVVILGYPHKNRKDTPSYVTGKYLEYARGAYYITSATITDGYSGGLAMAVKENCIIGIAIGSVREDPTKTIILDATKP